MPQVKLSVKQTFKPGTICRCVTPQTEHPRWVELVSYPFFPEDAVAERELRVKARMIPGDPTTMADGTLARCEADKTMSSPHRRWLYLHFGVAKPRPVAELILAFPDDMLRYDACQLMDFRARLSELRSPAMVCQVSTKAKPFWHPARWESFGWTLIPERTHKVDLDNNNTVVY